MFLWINATVLLHQCLFLNNCILKKEFVVSGLSD